MNETGEIEPRHGFEDDIDHALGYDRQRIQEVSLELVERYRHYFSEYFSLRDDMFNKISDGSPTLRGEEIVEYAEAVQRLDGASPREASEHASQLERVFVPGEKPQLISFDGFQHIGKFVVAADDIKSVQAHSFDLQKAPRLGDVNTLHIGSNAEYGSVLYYGSYNINSSPGYISSKSLWTTPISLKTAFDLRKIDVIDDPEEAKYAIHRKDVTNILVGEAALEDLKEKLSENDDIHIDAVTKLLAAQGLDIGSVDTPHRGEREKHNSLLRYRDIANESAEYRLLDFTKDYVHSMLIREGWNRPSREAMFCLPAVLNSNVIDSITTEEKISQAIINGFARQANIVDDELKTELGEQIADGKKYKYRWAITRALYRAAEQANTTLSSVEVPFGIRIDESELVKQALTDRARFRQLTLPQNTLRFQDDPSQDDEVTALLRRYPKTGVTFKKKSLA